MNLTNDLFTLQLQTLDNKLAEIKADRPITDNILFANAAKNLHNITKAYKNRRADLTRKDFEYIKNRLSCIMCSNNNSSGLVLLPVSGNINVRRFKDDLHELEKLIVLPETAVTSQSTAAPPSAPARAITPQNESRVPAQLFVKRNKKCRTEEHVSLSPPLPDSEHASVDKPPALAVAVAAVSSGRSVVPAHKAPQTPPTESKELAKPHSAMSDGDETFTGDDWNLELGINVDQFNTSQDRVDLLYKIYSDMPLPSHFPQELGTEGSTLVSESRDHNQHGSQDEEPSEPHQDQDEVRVSSGTVKGSGKGLFASRDLHAGFTLPYDGCMLSKEDFDAKYPEDSTAEYTVKFFDAKTRTFKYIDSVNSLSPAKYANELRLADLIDHPTLTINSQLVDSDTGPVLRIMMFVPSGEEIFTSYGPDFHQALGSDEEAKCFLLREKIVERDGALMVAMQKLMVRSNAPATVSELHHGMQMKYSWNAINNALTRSRINNPSILTKESIPGEDAKWSFTDFPPVAPVVAGRSYRCPILGSGITVKVEQFRGPFVTVTHDGARHEINRAELRGLPLKEEDLSTEAEKSEEPVLTKVSRQNGRLTYNNSLT